MKKILFISATIITTLMSSCILSEKDYNCECEYISSNGEPTKKETNTVKGRLLEDAKIECSFLENKYFNHSFDGTCIIK